MPKVPGWEKTFRNGPPRRKEAWGQEGTDKVIWIDNWSPGNYAVVLGRELGVDDPLDEGIPYEEEKTYTNMQTLAEARRVAVEYMREHPPSKNSAPRITQDQKRKLENKKSIKLQDNVFAIKKDDVLIVNIESEKRMLSESEKNKLADWAFEHADDLAEQAGARYTEVNTY